MKRILMTGNLYILWDQIDFLLNYTNSVKKQIALIQN